MMKGLVALAFVTGVVTAPKINYLMEKTAYGFMRELALHRAYNLVLRNSPLKESEMHKDFCRQYACVWKDTFHSPFNGFPYRHGIPMGDEELTQDLRAYALGVKHIPGERKEHHD